VFKVDFEKAYDMVNWEFLFYMLERLGFNAKWIKWIKGCLASSYVSVLVNRSPTSEFKPEKGLRQGDPLALFLFLVVVEGLSGAVREAEKCGLLEGLIIGRKEVHLSMLQFADDTMFLCKDNIQNIVTIKSILRCFQLASELKVNLNKSSIGGIRIDVVNLQRYAVMMNCNIMKLPFKYLGVPIGGSHNRVAFWNGLVEKVRNKLSKQKGKNISMAGRVTLIKSVISALPLYFMSLFKAPKTVCKELIRIQRQFLWGWGHDSKKMAWVSWNTVCKNRESGGLGVKDVEKFNKALLGKWKWRLGLEEEGLWIDIVNSKYGSWRSLDSIDSKKCESRWWRDLRSISGNSEGGQWFNKNLIWSVGSGSKIYFWEDV